MNADLLLCNLAHHGFDNQSIPLELIAIQGNRIAYAGSSDALADLKGPATRVLDCQGGLVLPGFNDAHCHPLAFAVSKNYLDCSPLQVAGIEDILSALRKQALVTSQQQWLRGAQIDVSAIAEKRLPTRWELDGAVPDLPVLLVERSGQQCALNSLALTRCGIDDAVTDAENERIERDPCSGKPSGIVSGNSARIARALPPLTDDQVEAGLRQANQEFLALGITSLQDTSWSNTHHHWESWQVFKQRGLLTPRLTMMAGYDSLTEFSDRGLRTGSGDVQLRLGAMKIALDESRGSHMPAQADLNYAALEAHLAGFQLAFHVPDVELLQMSLRALAFVRSTSVKECSRPRFEHCPVCPPALLPAVAESRAIVVSQPNLLHQTGPEYLEQVTAEQLKWVYPYRSFFNHGIRLAFSSDCPLTSCAPFPAMQTATTRRVAQGMRLPANEQLTLAEALDLYTAAGAYAAGEDHEKGSLSIGQLADLVVVHGSGRITPEYFAEAQVVMTLIDGQLVWVK
ncbi:MAG: amidohydrolase family protein [Betaproteobacteria bacterium]|nr:amidohydrolase family protein [Betaproteobacteria bacterium]